MDSVGVAPHCRPGVQGCSCGLLLKIRGTSARETQPPQLAANFGTALDSKLRLGPSSTMKLLLLTLAAMLLLSQLTPGNVDLLREGAREGDPGLVREHPGARRTSFLGLRRCQVPELRYQQHPEYLIHHPLHAQLYQAGPRASVGAEVAREEKATADLLQNSPQHVLSLGKATATLMGTRISSLQLPSLYHTLCWS